MNRLTTATGAGRQRFASSLIEPVIVDRAVLLPQGAEVIGRVTRARGIGFGLIHETARLQLAFETVVLPWSDSAALPIRARIVEIDNAREEVDKTGTVNGILSTSTIGHRLSGISTLAAVEPMLFVFSFAAFSMVRGHRRRARQGDGITRAGGMAAA